MKFSKIRNVKSPCRGTSRAAGIDFFVPERWTTFVDSKQISCTVENLDFITTLRDKNPQLLLEPDGFRIYPHMICMIPSGIKCLIPQGYYLSVGNKSGVAAKRGLVYTADTIDEDYEGEIFFALANITNEAQKVYYGDKIIQLKLQEVSYEDVEEVTIDDLTQLYTQRGSERGEGCLGSTGVK